MYIYLTISTSVRSNSSSVIWPIFGTIFVKATVMYTFANSLILLRRMDW
jgi:hypothetical protein